MWQIVERFETPGLPVLLMIAWLTLVTLLSIWYMKRTGIPVFMPAFASPRFIETWRSGHMCFPMLLRLGGARSCLWVVVGEDFVQVGPHFPFSLGFVAAIWQLQFKAPAASILSVKRAGGILGGVIIAFSPKPGTIREFRLWLRSPDAFIAAIRQIQPDAEIRTSGVLMQT